MVCLTRGRGAAGRGHVFSLVLGGEIMPIRIVLFDLFGTLVDMSGVPREEMADYARQIARPTWEPLVLPASWNALNPFYDVGPGLSALSKLPGVLTVTLSNAPMAVQAALMSHNWLFVGAYMAFCFPVAMVGAYKPNPEVYRAALRVFPELSPDQFLMVTANEQFGDLEGAAACGMQTMLIRGDTGLDVRSVAERVKNG